MDRERCYELNRASLAGLVRLMAAGAEQARLFEAPGVVGSVNPGCSERSLPNSVVYESADRLAAAYDDAAAAYDEAGCAWTVWVPEDDAPAARLLEDRGHVLDATPRAMAAELAAMDLGHPDDLEWRSGAAAEVLCLLNDRAYGYPEGTFARGFGSLPGTHVYEARRGGEPACVLFTYDVGDDTSVCCVATVPEARGTGLASRLLAAALEEARGRGMVTTSLQATSMGAGVYRRLGYGDYGALQMWERRPPQARSPA